ncbi:hypothetical protein D3C87_1785850 [compost metagenome]
MVDDQKVLLDLTRGLFGMKPRAATNHLPKLDLAEDGLGEHQVLNGRHVDTSIEHVHRDGHARHGSKLEIIQRGISTLHVAVDDLDHTLALQLRVQAVEALVQPLGVSVANGKDDGLVR